MFKILRKEEYQQLLEVRNDLRQQRLQYNQLESINETLEKQKGKSEEETAELKQQLEILQQKVRDYELLQAEHQKLKEEVRERLTEEIDGAVKELGFSRTQVERLWEDRVDLIELYNDKSYNLAKQFAIASKEMRKNRGLFLLLVDNRNMVNENFSEFYDGQTEHLIESQYKGIAQLPHVFSPKINEVFNYMGEKVLLKDENGEITGYEERDGALLVDLRGIVFRSRIMVEGVRTHRVYGKVESLQKGNAKHNAAIYASSLYEVMSAIVISEEDSEVTMFRDGRFIKSYNPYTDVERLREEETAPVLPEADVQVLEETTIIENGNATEQSTLRQAEILEIPSEETTTEDSDVEPMEEETVAEQLEDNPTVEDNETLAPSPNED